MRTKLTFLLLTMLSYFPLKASHSLAAHFSYRSLGGHDVELVLTTYTDPSAAFVDRCTVDFEVWDSVGSQKIMDLTGVERVNGPLEIDPLYPNNILCPSGIHMGEYMIGTIKKSVYTTTFIFPGDGKYMVRFYDVARVGNIANMAGSGSQSFYVETMVTIDAGLGAQNSVVMLNHQIEFAGTGQTWTFNPGGWDPDGDSLVYRLAVPKRYEPPTIPNPISCSGYRNVELIGNNAPLIIDAQTGMVTWDSPQDLGVYCFAIQVLEYRGGVLLDSLLMDQLVMVEPCTNHPPAIMAITDTTILAGTTLHLDFAMYDPDSLTDSLYAYLDNAGIGFNSAFVANPAAVATLLPSGNLPIAGTETVRGSIDWATDAAQARSAPYQIDLFAHDNIGYYGQSGMNRLGRHHVILVHLTGPVGVVEAAEDGLYFSMYPNLAMDVVHLDLKDWGVYSVTILGAQGDVARHVLVKGIAWDVDLAGLSSGLYFVQVQGRNGWQTEKLIVGRP